MFQTYLSKILLTEYFIVQFQLFIGINNVRCLQHRYFFVESTTYKCFILSGCRMFIVISGIFGCNTNPLMSNQAVLIDGKAITRI